MKKEIEVVEAQEEKGEAVMTEKVEQSKPMFTIRKDMLVVSTTNMSANPASYDYNALELFLENNKESLESYFNDNENNYGIGFYACGYDGRAQQEFAQAWADNGVRVF